MKRILLLFSLLASAYGQLLVNNVVRFTDGTNTINAGDNANNALRVNVVAGGASGGTSSNFGSAFPSAGTAAGFYDGSNMQGARVFDVDSGAGSIYVMGVNLRRTASGAATELIGQQAMADSLPVTLASNQSALAVSQSGTWTVQPGNTANTTPWFVKSVPYSSCAGTTVQDVTQVDVATGAGTALTSADTCVELLYLTNKTTSNATATVRDKNGTPFGYLETFVLPGNSALALDFKLLKFTAGVQVIAGTASALNARLKGIQ